MRRARSWMRDSRENYFGAAIATDAVDDSIRDQLEQLFKN